jgi:hypothetical protein
LAVDWQKVVEINHIFFFVKFSSKTSIQNFPEKENIIVFGSKRALGLKEAQE